jgi:hypothetical protein
MDTREAGKQNAEDFVTKVVQRLKQDGSVDSFLWWPEISPEPGGPGAPGDTVVPLRVFKGRSWKSIAFAGSDIDGSVDNPRVLDKYEREVEQCVTEL